MSIGKFATNCETIGIIYNVDIVVLKNISHTDLKGI